MAESKPSDHVIRDRITDNLDVSMLVEASAGTGKTTCLFARMVNLLRQGRCEIATLATVTFTRKSAAELRVRFQSALEDAVASATGQERDRLVQALANIQRCFIGTIHAFCAQLIRERSIESGIDPGFTELEEAADTALRQQAWRDYVAQLIATDDPILPELERLGLKLSPETKQINTLVSELDELGLEPAQLGPAFMTFAEFADVQEWPAERVELPDLDPCRAELAEYGHHIAGVELPAVPRPDKLTEKFSLLSRLIPRADFDQTSQLMDVLCHFESFAKRSAVVQKNWKAIGVDSIAELDRWNEFCQRVAEPLISTWLEHRYEAVMRALKPALTVYDSLRQQNQTLNFQDLLLVAAQLLRQQPAARRYFRERFTHLLIDEFQDTDPIQAEVMLLLTADDPDETNWLKCRPVPGSLFVVGDPKQSIYRFRRADILTYEKVRQRIQSAGGEVLTLSANFRSTPPIIDWVNDCFANRFSDQESRYSPRYSPLAAGRNDAGEADSGVERLTMPDSLTNLEEKGLYEADQIARAIRSAIDDKLPVPRSTAETAAGLPDHVVAGDYMVIVRQRKPTTIYADALRRYGLPTAVTGGSVLNQVPELSLLHRCLVAVTRSDDAIALMAVLRGELFGVNDDTLYEVVRCGGRLHYQFPLPDELSAEAESQLVPIMDRMQRYAVWLRQLPTVTAIERIAADLGLLARACAQTDGISRAGSLLKAIELLRTMPDLVAVGDYVDAIGRMVDLSDLHDGVAVRSPIEAPVRVMNLHQCKGLESNVVFLAYPGSRFTHPVRIHVDRQQEVPRGYLAIYGLQRAKFQPPPLLARPAAWSEFAAEEQRFLDAEDDRLMYVAATRSRRKLVICDDKKNHHWSVLKPSLENADEFLVGTPTEMAQAAPVDLGADWETTVSQIDRRWQAVRQPTYATQAIKATALVSTQKPSSEQLDGMQWGNVIHRLLEAVMNRADEFDLQPLALSLLDQEQLDASLHSEVVKTVAEIRRSEIWQRARKSDECLTEVPIAWLTNDELPTVARGVIDLVFREGQEWIIVDYKSERVDARHSSELEVYYRPQIEAYANAWQQLTGGKVKQSGILLTHTGKFLGS